MYGLDAKYKDIAMFFAHPNSHHQLFCWIWSWFSSKDCRKQKLNRYLQPQWPLFKLKVKSPQKQSRNSNQNKGHERVPILRMIYIYTLVFVDFTADPLRRNVFKTVNFYSKWRFPQQLRLPPKRFPTFNGDGFRGTLLPAKDGVDEFKLQLPPSCDGLT